MTELNKKLTKKALECCIKEKCEDCIHHGVTGCIGYLLKDALSLINELEEQQSEVQK